MYISIAYITPQTSVCYFDIPIIPSSVPAKLRDTVSPLSDSASAWPSRRSLPKHDTCKFITGHLAVGDSALERHPITGRDFLS
jgi:hypothetical protein